MPPAARQRLEDAILGEIECLGEAVEELEWVDMVLLEAGVAALGSEGALAIWLIRPPPALGYRTPLALIASTGGREEVLGLLRALEAEGEF